MGDSSWWVGVLTAVTALGASWVTSRGNANGARVQAEVAAHTKEVADARDRRREAYKDLSAQVNALSEVLWRMEVVDQSSSTATRTTIVGEMQAASREAVSRVTKASRDVLLEGPADVAERARELRRLAVNTHLLLIRLVDGTDELRADYNRAYRLFRDHHIRFIEAARNALEVR
ncbi:hypothetical protein [Actinacidiphila paucisporea]|nr:hypothetical protein [Actinacidiphila paucisporea]